MEEEKNSLQERYEEPLQAIIRNYFNIPVQEGQFPEYPTNFTKEIQEAQPKEDLLTDIMANQKTIYFSYLRDAMEKKGLPLEFDSILPESEVLKTMDRAVSQAMFRDGLPYLKVCECMMYSPTTSLMENEVQQRFMMGVLMTSTNVCPIYVLPEVQQAKPLLAIDPVLAEPSELYDSFLKAALDRKPEMRLQEADEKAIQLMKKNHISRDVVEKAMEASMAWIRPSQTVEESEAEYLQRVTDFEHEKKEFVFNAWNKDGKELSVKHDEDLYTSMQSNLKDVTARKQQMDMVNYWSKTIDIMDYTLRKYDELNLAKKTLKLWTIAISKAVKDLGMEKDAQAIETMQNISRIQKQFDEKADNFKEVMNSLKSIEHFSMKLMQHAEERNRSNPLLSQIDIQHAEPFEQVAQEKEVLTGRPEKETARRLYASAVREVLKENFIRDPVETEVAAAKYMKDHSVMTDWIEAALGESTYHNFKNKPPAEKAAEIQEILQASDRLEPEKGDTR